MMRILSVDDSKTVRAAVKSIVEVIGIELLEAEDGLEGQKVLDQVNGDVDLILLDWEMPNVDGYEFLTKVKKDKRYRDIPVIMLTTVSQKEKMIEAIRAGAKQYITKPFSSETLLTKIIQALGIDSLEEL
ncbi:MAG: response regulator [Candidatus Latescibacteria bacterium]|nr:response regulator [Candidatus Latescibacterota bacterium]